MCGVGGGACLALFVIGLTLSAIRRQRVPDTSGSSTDSMEGHSTDIQEPIRKAAEIAQQITAAMHAHVAAEQENAAVEAPKKRSTGKDKDAADHPAALNPHALKQAAEIVQQVDAMLHEARGMHQAEQVLAAAKAPRACTPLFPKPRVVCAVVVGEESRCVRRV